MATAPATGDFVVIHAIITIGLLLLALGLYYRYTEGQHGLSKKLSEFLSFQWVPSLLTQPHMIPTGLQPSSTTDFSPKPTLEPSYENNRERELNALRSEAQRAKELESELTTLRQKNNDTETRLQHSVGGTGTSLARDSSSENESSLTSYLSEQEQEQEQEILKNKHQSDRVTQLEATLEDRERAQREQSRKIEKYEYKIGALEESIRKAETSSYTESLDNLEYRRLQSELMGVTRQRDKYVDQIKSLETQLRENNRTHPIQDREKTAYRDTAKITRPQPLFTTPLEKDDLKKIKGIGDVMESTLNDLGVTSFKQLGQFSQGDIERVSEALSVFPGRIERDNWVLQAKEQYQDKYGIKLA